MKILSPLSGQATARLPEAIVLPEDPVQSPNRLVGLLGLALVFLQVGLVAATMRAVGVEGLGFRRIIYLLPGAFLVHHFLPARFRLQFFCALSLTAAVLFFGGTIDSRFPDLGLGLLRTVVLVGVGIVLIGICHLKLPFWSRAAFLALAGVVIATFRAGFWGSGPVAIVWPVLAALFMFRLMVYLYDLSTSPKPPSAGQTAAYFFLLPNPVSLLFPVIDFRTFTQKYFDEPRLVIYQRGAKWMARGLIHLLLYRAVDRLFYLEASAVSNGSELIQFVITNLFLYLKVSGTFHLLIGSLLLFGFNLPETNHRYFLASSFTDYWRRVNIYWRNFIMKVFYYPTFFRFKKRGQVQALIIATLWSFFVTWLLHLYQTWWIRGSVTYSWTDTLFWGSLALLVLGNALWELKRNRQRRLPNSRFTLRETAGLALRTAATFSVIAVLWSLWSTPTLSQWIHLWSLADGQTAKGAGLALGVVMLATVIVETRPATREAAVKTSSAYARSRHFRRDSLRGMAVLVALFALTHPSVRAHLQGRESLLLNDLEAIADALSQKDLDARGQARGYYENLTSADEGSGQYYEAMNPGQGFRYRQPSRTIEGTHFGGMQPNVEFEHHGWRFRTNQWGLRGRDFPLEKPPGVQRVALLGSSQVMGYGLTDEAMFATQLEAGLNATRGRPGLIEILNFSVGGLSPLGQIETLSQQVAPFQPDVVLFVSHSNDFEWSVRDVVRTVRSRYMLPAEVVDEILPEARVQPTTPHPIAVARLRRSESAIVSLLYGKIVEACRTIGAVPVFVFIPVPTDLPLNEVKTIEQIRLAEAAGFVVINLANVFDGHDPTSLTLRDQGRHINELGNELIASALHRELVAHPALSALASP